MRPLKFLIVFSFIVTVIWAAKPVDVKPTMKPYFAAIHVTNVAMSEYVDAFLYSDSTVFAYVFTGSVIFQKYSFSGRKIIDLAPGFNQWINLDDQGYVWRSDLSATTGTRLDLDTFGNAFNQNRSVYGYFFSYMSISTDSSTIWYWGFDSYNFYALTGGNQIAKPVKLHAPAGKKFVKLAAGNNLLALTSLGEIIQWNNGDTNYVTKTIPAGSKCVDISASHNDFYLAVIHDYSGGNANLGHLYWWGSQNGFIGDVTSRSQPFLATSIFKTVVGVALPYTFAEVACNDNVFHARDSINDVYGEGDNAQGEIGNGRDTVLSYKYTSQYAWNTVKGIGYTNGVCYLVLHNIKKCLTGTSFTFYKMYLRDDDSLLYNGRNKSFVLPEGIVNGLEVTYPNGLDIDTPRLGGGLWHPAGVSANFVLPTMSAGSNQSIGVNTTTLTVSGNPAKIGSYGYSFATYQWSQVSGTTATINSPTANSTTVTLPAPGAYRFRMTTLDTQGGTDTASVLVTYTQTGCGGCTVLKQFRGFKRI